MKKNTITNKFKLVKWKNKLVPTLFGSVIALTPLMAAAVAQTRDPNPIILGKKQTQEKIDTLIQKDPSDLEDREYNKIPKIVAHNFYNKKDFDAKVVDKILYVIKNNIKNVAIVNQVKLLRNISSEKISSSKNKYYKIKMSEIKKDRPIFSTDKKNEYDIESIKNIVDDKSNVFSKFKEIFIQISKNNLKDNKDNNKDNKDNNEVGSFTFNFFRKLESGNKWLSSGVKRTARLILRKNQDDKFDLWLQYIHTFAQIVDGATEESVMKYEIEDLEKDPEKEKKYVAQNLLSKLFKKYEKESTPYFSNKLKSDFLKYDNNKEVSLEDLGIKIEKEEEYKRFSYSYKIKENKKNGILKVEVTLKSGEFSQTKEFFVIAKDVQKQKESQKLFLELGLLLYNKTTIVHTKKKLIPIGKAIQEIKNARAFSGYIGKKLLDIPNIERAIFTPERYGDNVKVTITIDGLPANKKIEYIITGLKTQLEFDKKEALSKIGALDYTKFNNIYDANAKKKLASDDSNTSDEKKEAIVAMIQKEITGTSAKTLIKKTLISFNTNSPGILKIIIDLESLGHSSPKEISIPFFPKNQASIDVKKEQERIDNLFPQISKIDNKLRTITKFVTQIAADSLTAEDLGINTDKTPGVEHVITHKKIVKNELIEIIINIKKGNEELRTSILVEIFGINKAKKNKKIVDAAKARIEELFSQNKKINKPAIQLAANSLTAKDLGIDSINFSQLKYKITHEQVDSNKRINVSIEITKGSQTTRTIINVEIIGIDEKKQLGQDRQDLQIVNGEKAKIEERFSRNKIITKFVTQLDANSLNIRDLGINTKTNLGITYKFKHYQVDNDVELLDIEIKIQKGSKSATAKIEAEIKGINKTIKATEAIKAAKALFSKLISDETPTNLLKGATTLPSTLKDETNPNKIGFNNPLEKEDVDDKGVIATFSIKSVDDEKGSLVVEVTLSKAPGKSETFRFTLIGYQTTSKANEVKEATEAIKAAKALFSKLISDGTPTNLLKGATTLPSTLKDETNPNKIGFNNPLEKPKANPKRVIATFSVKDVDDANGKLKVEVTLSKAPGKSETFRFTLIGYQTTSKANEVKEATEAIKAAKALFSKLISACDGTPTNLLKGATTLPSTLKDETNPNKIGFNNPLEKEDVDDKGVIATFSIKSVDDANGKLKVEVTLSKAPGKSETFRFTLIGYQTTSEANEVKEATEAIKAAKALFSKLISDETPTNLLKGATTLPSTLKDETNPNKIGFNNPLEKPKANPKRVIATFSVKDVDDANGKLKVEVTLSKAPGKSETFRFTLIGYQTTSKANEVKEATEAIKAAKALFSKLISAFDGTPTNLLKGATTLPSTLSGETNPNKIGFNNPLEKEDVDDKGVIAAFSVKDVDDANGKLKVEVTLSKAPGKSETFRFTLIGYQTTSKANEVKEATEAIKAAKALFSKLISAFDGTPTNLLKGATTLPSTLKDETNPNKIGFNNPLEKPKANPKRVIAAFSVKDVDDANGKLKVEVTLSKAPGKSETFRFTLIGYQTTSKANEVKEATEAIKAAKALFSKLISACDGTPTNLLKGATTLPSTLKDETNPNKIGFNNPLEKEDVDDKGVIATFSIKSVDDANGKLKVEVTLSKAPGKSETFRFTLIGYQTTSEANEVKEATEAIKAAKALFSKLISDETPTNLLKGATTLPSTLSGETNPNKIGFNNPLEKEDVDDKGVIAAFSVKDVDDANGKLKVEVTLSKAPGKSETFRFTLIGYQTTNQAISAANKRIKLVKALFDNLVNAKHGTEIKLLSKKITFPSTLKKVGANTPKDIGFDLPAKVKDNRDVTISFSIKNVNDANGSLVVESTISKTPGKSEKIKFTLTGYRNTNKTKSISSHLKDIDKEKTRINKLVEPAKIHKLLSRINKNSLLKSELALGKTPEGIKYEIIHDAITYDGNFDITIKITKNGEEAKAIRKVSITGIDETKQKIAFQKTSGLSKGVIAGIIIGASIFTLGFAFIFFKIKKTKKLNN